MSRRADPSPSCVRLKVSSGVARLFFFFFPRKPKNLAVVSREFRFRRPAASGAVFGAGVRA